jgi:hypothetical protein
MASHDVSDIICQALPHGDRHGRAVQVEPTNPVMKAPVIMLSKLSYDGPPLNFAGNFNLRRYNTVAHELAVQAASRENMKKWFHTLHDASREADIESVFADLAGQGGH